MERTKGPQALMIASLEREVRRLQWMLAECYLATGAESRGDEDWYLAEKAVDEVRRLREECDSLESKDDEVSGAISDIEAYSSALWAVQDKINEIQVILGNPKKR